MDINRQIVLEKLKGYLDNKISKDEVYEWVKSIVISKQYDKIEQADKLLSDTIQALFELHHDDGKFDPSKEELGYYMRCLEGKADFPPR